MDHAEPERTVERILAAARGVLDRIDLGEGPPRLLDDALTRRRHQHVVLAPLEELHAEFVFELLHCEAERRLADEPLLRGTAEMHFARHRHDVTEFLERHSEVLISTTSICSLYRPDLNIELSKSSAHRYGSSPCRMGG